MGKKILIAEDDPGLCHRPAGASLSDAEKAELEHEKNLRVGVDGQPEKIYVPQSKMKRLEIRIWK